MKRKLFLLFFSIVTFLHSYSQEGNYYVTNYPPTVFSASQQSWSIIQDSLKRIFVANNSGVLMYDGKYWTTIPVKDAKSAYSLAESADGKTIYVGSESEYGYIQFDALGIPLYVSLSTRDTLKTKEKDYGNVWSIQRVDSNYFFCSNKRIFWYVNHTFKKVYSPTGEKFHTFFNIENTLLVREAGVGLIYFNKGKLTLIPGTEILADVKVRAVIQRKKHLYWLCTDKGLFLLSFDITHPAWSLCTKVKSDIDSWMEQNELYCGLKITPNTFALGSLAGGVVIVDSAFQLINIISYKTGLQDDGINYMYKDFSGDIWMVLNNGIGYVEISTPLTHWTRNNGILGSIQAIAKYNNTLYISTDKGIEKLDNENNLFEATDIKEEAWDFYNYKDKLLAGTSSGLYLFEGNAIKKIFSANGVQKIFYDSLTNYFYLASYDTLYKGTVSDNAFTVVKRYSASDLISATKDAAGRIYFGSGIDGTVSLFDPKQPDSLVTLDNKNGLPKMMPETHVFNYKGSLLAATDTGIFALKSTEKFLFTRDSLYNVFAPSTRVTRGMQEGDDIWIACSAYDNESMTNVDEVCVLRHTKKGFKLDYKLLKHMRGQKAYCFLKDLGKIFIGTNDGLIEYNTKTAGSRINFYTFIAKVFHKEDSDAVYQNISAASIAPNPEFTYAGNQITFYGSASDYYDKSEIEFSYYLEGLEQTYCHWTRNNKIAYTKLHEGHYTLHLKSRDIFGVEGTPVTFSFTILPPWYRTIWAYIVYILAGIGFIMFIVRYNTRRLKEQNIKLEKIITERTKTIAVQKEEIEEKNKDITKSISYAKLIQQAILPPIDEIKKVWSNLFIFYQPKDIVSGDFYWFNKVSDTEILIGCADCTGHGVPGGFMSMICSDKLSDAVAYSTLPSEILFHTNNGVKTTLRQTAEENVNKDGMEVVLVKIDLKTKKLYYSGANRPLLIMKKKTGDMIELKPTKSGIASFTPFNYKFDGIEMQLEEGDTIYLSSDGYSDQFGGPDGKKFMTKNFKNFIMGIFGKPMPEQEKLVNENINNWMKGYEQVDDLLVIGIQI